MFVLGVRRRSEKRILLSLSSRFFIKSRGFAEQRVFVFTQTRKRRVENAHYYVRAQSSGIALRTFTEERLEIPQRKNFARDFTFGSFCTRSFSLSRERSFLRRGGDDGEKRRRRRAAAEKAVVGVQRARLLLTLGVFFPSRRRFGIRQLLDGIMRLARTTTTTEEEDKRDDETTTLPTMLLSSKLARW